MDGRLAQDGFQGDAVVGSESGNEGTAGEGAVGAEKTAVEIARGAEMADGRVSARREGKRTSLTIQGSVFARLDSIGQDLVVVHLESDPRGIVFLNDGAPQSRYFREGLKTWVGE